jgi:hypothetical protein
MTIPYLNIVTMAGFSRYTDLKLSNMLTKSFINVLSILHIKKIYPSEICTVDILMDIMSYLDRASAKEVADCIRLIKDLDKSSFDELYGFIQNDYDDIVNINKRRLDFEEDSEDSYTEEITSLKDDYINELIELQKERKSMKLCKSCSGYTCYIENCPFIHFPDSVMSKLHERNLTYMFCYEHYEDSWNCELFLHAADIYSILTSSYRHMNDDNFIDLLVGLYKKKISSKNAKN